MISLVADLSPEPLIRSYLGVLIYRVVYGYSKLICGRFLGLGVTSPMDCVVGITYAA